jgi:hypothetical protein
MKFIIICLSMMMFSVGYAAPANQLPVKPKLIMSTGVVIKPATAAVVPKPIATKPVTLPPVVDPGVTFGLEFNPRYTTQAEKQSDGTRSETITYEFVPSIKTLNYKLKTTSDFYYQVKDQSGNEWDNTLFDGTINNAWELGEYFKLSPNLLVALPLFKRTSDFNSFIGARLTLALNSKNADVPDLILKYGVQFGKLSYKKDITGGSYNIDTRLRQRVHLGYQLTGSLLAFIYFHLDSNFLLDNTVKNSFYHESFLEYTINDHMNVSAGVSNGGGVFKGENQEEDNIKFYDKNSSEVFFGFGFNI